MALRRSSLLTYFIIPLFVLACGSSKKNNKDSGIGDDDDDDDDIDAPVQEQCLVDSSYTYTATANAAAVSAGSGSSADDPHFEAFQDGLNADPTPDVIDVELYANIATYAGGDITTGSVTLTGDELNYATCGACVRLLADLDPDNGQAQDLFATGGTVNVTSVGTTDGSGITTGTLAITLSNIQFEHVTIDDTTFESTPVGDGCTSSLASASLSGDITDLEAGSAFAPNQNVYQPTARGTRKAAAHFRMHRVK